MKRKSSRHIYGYGLILLLLSAAGWGAWIQVTQNRGWKTVERTLGYPGKTQGDGFRVEIPRRDLNVLVQGAWLDPQAGLSSWFNFRPQEHDCLLQGELCLVDAEVAQVEERLVAQGLTLTALYRPYIGESPGVERLRFEGRGSRAALAQKARVLLAATGMPFMKPVVPPVGGSTAWALPVEKALGAGSWQGLVTVYRFVPKDSSITGPESQVFFQPDGKQAEVYGQWVVPTDQFLGFSKALLDEKITVISMVPSLPNAPALITFSFWTQGDPGSIAKRLARVLSKTGLTLAVSENPKPQAAPASQ